MKISKNQAINLLNKHSSYKVISNYPLIKEKANIKKKAKLPRDTITVLVIKS